MLAAARKDKGLSQGEPADKVESTSITIGRYERGDIKPSIEVAGKIADALEVSLDYLVGKSTILLDKQTLVRIEDISTLPDDKKAYVLNLIDMCLRDFKARKAYA